jgi:site-specific DNA-adenine methylase
MDGKQGVNSEEQVNLLNLVKESMDTKEVPVIICNKVDDPTDSWTHRRSSLEGRRDIRSRLSETALHKVLEAGSQTSVLFGQYRQPLFLSGAHAYPSERVADES